MSSLVSKLLVGTASFGAEYGLANSIVPSPKEVRGILRSAEVLGFFGYDTARDYGVAEKLVGLARATKLKGYTKFSHGTDYSNRSLLIEQVLDSAKNLERNSIYAIAPHSFFEFMSTKKRSLENMEALKSEGFIKFWGVTLYSPDELKDILELCQPDYVQIPVNALDRRFLTSGMIDRAKDRGVEIHARSVFLQGALLQPPEKLPSFLLPLSSQIVQIMMCAQENGVSVLKLLVQHSMLDERIDKLVVGVNSMTQLDEIYEVSASHDSLDFSRIHAIEQVEPTLLDPRNWQK